MTLHFVLAEARTELTKTTPQTADGVLSLGSNSKGQLGHGDTIPRTGMLGFGRSVRPGLPVPLFC